MQPRNKILAVDDDVIDIITIERLLGEDYDLKTARTGEEALQIDAEEQKLLVEMMNCAAKRLHRFFENVMLLSSLKSGKWEFNPAPTNLCAIIRGMICEMTTKAAERNVKIEAQFDAIPIICLDRKGIKRAVTAILDNAIRFNPADGRISVCVSCDNGDVCIRVTDEGDGIDPDYLPYIFEELSDPDIDYHSQGQGLSLAIARQIVQRHNGVISAESTKGSGATFTVRLPVMALSEAAQCER